MSTKECYAPVRPPRASEWSKETNGLLMNIIAELSVRSKSDTERQRRLEKLKKDYLSSDSRLLKLISGQQQQLVVTREAFSKISAKINTSRLGAHNVREKLKAATQSLKCKRTDIRRLWTESVEHQGVISILQEIDNLHSVPSKVEDLLKEQEFLKATRMLVSALFLLENKLSEADALKDLKNELNILKKKLHASYIEEIHQIIYQSSPQVYLKNGNDDEGCTKHYDESVISRNDCDGKLMSEKRTGDYNASSFCSPNCQKISDLLECFAILNTLPEMLDSIENNCSRKLMQIITSCTDAMCDNIEKDHTHFSFADRENSQNDKPSYHLKDLLTEILDKFQQVAVNHYALIHNVEQIATTKNLTDLVHFSNAMPVVYSKIQAAIELFATSFLDFHNIATIKHTVEFSANVPTNISAFFLRTGNTRTKRKPNRIFQFDSSSHAMSKKNYSKAQIERGEDHKISMQERGELESAENDRNYLIAQPNVKNIKLLYKPLKQFICDVKIALHLENVDQCPLHTFLFDAVKMLLDQINMDINRLMERNSISLNAWKPVTDNNELQQAEAKAPQILNSTLEVNSCLKELEELIYALPDYSSHFLQLMVNVLENYNDMCNGAYKSLVYAFGDLEDQKIFSVLWARDVDISRLLRSLPNWMNMEIDDASADVRLDYKESPEEIHFRNKAESELLIRNLSCKETISPSEIILEYGKLTNLALMHESMEWFSSSIMRLADRLPDVQENLEQEQLDEMDANTDVLVAISTKCLKKLAEDFQDLASTCLLVLHLEVRAHCFFYLLKLYKGSYINRKDDEKPEPEILKFNQDLSKINEALSPVLQPKKMRYVFEGLGDLLSTILINCVPSLKRINENGVKKMGRNIFAIQQNLATITMAREVALDRARQYFELLNHSIEDILNKIMEEGPQFQEHEYSAVIHLLHDCREGIYEQESSSYYLEKLRQILDEVAVSV